MKLARSLWMIQKLILCYLLASGAAQAQIVPDETLGNERSRVVPMDVRSDRIEGGALRGVNLFHSFLDFNVGEGRGAYFANPATVQNIFSRVTGGNLSKIDGMLGVLGQANLFLLNPNGIIFGPNARLDIAGSFLASTASRLTFPDGSEFSTTNPQNPSLLTVNLTPGLQYGANQPQATISNRGNLKAGQNLTLAAGNLDLQDSLQAGRDLTLQAQDTVKVRDTATTPFFAVAGGNVLVQGNRTIDIFVLNHLNSVFRSGRNLVLRSNNSVIGDAHFYAGGNFRVEQLDGHIGNLFSPHDPVILTNGNVSLGDYTGASLHILAGGSVTLNNVTITGTGDISTTINPNNTVIFNGSKTYADLATFNLTDYQIALNSDGTVRSVDPLLVPITINGSTQATLDVRAGVDWASLGGLPTSPIISGVTISPLSTGTASNAGITVTGNIQVNRPAGSVLLTNQFSPNTLPGTITIQGNVDASTNVFQATGGTIRVYGRGDIEVIGADTSIPLSLNSSSFGGKGSNISLATNSGTISLTNSNLRSSSRTNFEKAGDGGAISLAINSGNIFLTNVSLSSESFVLSNRGTPLVGSFAPSESGGAISLTIGSGNITLKKANLESYSVTLASSGNARSGGAISLTTNTGNISLTDTRSNSESSARVGNAGSGGAISFATNSGNISLINSDSVSGSSWGKMANGGAISFVTNSGNISLTSSNSNSGSLGGGSGGAISFVTNSGNISLTSSNSNSGSLGGGSGGAISFVTNSGNISLTSSNSSSYSFSNSPVDLGGEGNGGAISLLAPRGDITSNGISSLQSFAVSTYGWATGKGGAVALEATAQITNLEILTQSSAGLGGTVEIKGNSDLVITDTQISTSKTVTIPDPTGRGIGSGSITFEIGKTGQSGAITVSSASNLTFDNTVIQSSTQGTDPAGNVSITSPAVVTFQNNSHISSNTNSTGSAGRIKIDGGQGIFLTNGSQLFATTRNLGKAGDITLNAPILTVMGNSQISAETQGSGLGGSITVNAPTAVNLMQVQDFSPVLSVETSGAGQAGDIVINTPALTLSDTARITATATATATNTDGGGSITLNASQMNLAGIVGVFAETQGQSPAGTLRLNPYNNQPTLDVTLAPNSKISASTSGSGNGGDLILKAPQAITLEGAGKLAVETTGIGKAGDINISTPELTLKNGVEVSASTSADGKGGNIFINSRQMNITDGSKFAISSIGGGDSGSLTIQAKDLIMDRNALLNATSSSSQGGDINLKIQDVLLLRRSSNITTTSGLTGGSGNGGNIDIKTKFIIGLPQENSDIIANAFNGSGGKVNINAQRLFWIAPLSREQLISKLGTSDPAQLNPNNLSSNDVTAISQNNPNLSGQVTLNTLNVDPSQGLTPLPTGLDDPSKNIDTTCSGSRSQSASQFVITGRGGLPPNPSDPLTPNAILIPQATADQTNPSSQSATASSSAIVEAQGFVHLPNGRVRFVAQSSTAAPHTPWQSIPNCSNLSTTSTSHRSTSSTNNR